MLGSPSDKWIMLGVSILVILSMILATALIGYDMKTFPDIAEEKCNRLNLELFDYSMGSFFTKKSITCWNPETKETRIIQ